MEEQKMTKAEKGVLEMLVVNEEQHSREKKKEQ